MNNIPLTEDNYKRPKETYTDRLDDEDITNLLQDYIKVEQISEVKINTHLRYFTLESDKKTGTIERKFRMGGYLSNKDHADKYVILSNGKKTWSVQVQNTVFYRKMSIPEIKEEYEKDLAKYERMNKKLLKLVNKLKKALTDNGIDYHDL
jgi:hypothetical protein